MLLWFAGGAWGLVWAVFRDPRLDIRVLVAAAVVPDVVDLVLGGAGPGHSVVVDAAVLAGVVAATSGNRGARRRWLAAPIGLFAHLVLDGAWLDRDTFWWPLSGGGFRGRSIPVGHHPVAVTIVEELIGALLLWRSFRRWPPEAAN